MKISLIGDSVFDNKVYIGANELDTCGRVREALPGHDCQLLAVDGAVTEGVLTSQIPAIKDDTAAIFVSSGGNDALMHSGILYSPPDMEMFGTLHQAQADFADIYGKMISALKATGIPCAAFTIYSGNFPDPTVQNAATVAISIFNDVIYRACAANRVKVLEMRDICCAPEHFANEIEPSSLGSQQIAEAIRAVLTG